MVEKLGHKYRKVEELEDDPKSPRTEYISTESIGAAEGAVAGTLMYVGAGIAGATILASGGPLSAAFTAAALAAGSFGLFGAALAKMVGDHHAQYLEEQLKHGGLLLWVRARDAIHEKRAIDLLRRNSARDVHAHFG